MNLKIGLGCSVFATLIVVFGIEMSDRSGFASVEETEFSWGSRRRLYASVAPRLIC